MTMPDAYEVLALAEAAEAARASHDGETVEQAEAGLRAFADQVNPAVAWLIEHDRPAALRLVGALSIHWQDAGQVDEGRSLTDRALDGGHHAAARDRLVAAAMPRALLTASELAFRQGDQATARKRAREAIRAAVLIEDYVTASLAHSSLARVAYRAGEAAEIERQARKALQYAGDDPVARRGALHMLAWAAHTAGNRDEARRRFDASLEYRRQVGNRLSVAVELANIGDLAREEGDHARAAHLLAEALAVSHELGSKYMLVNTLPSFAALAEEVGVDDDAARLFGTADGMAAAAGVVADPGTEMAEHRERLRNRMGEAAFAERLAEGSTLSAEDAVALCLNLAQELGGQPVAGESDRPI